MSEEKIHKIILVGDHVITQVIEAEFVIGAVGDIGGISDLALCLGKAIDDCTKDYLLCRILRRKRC